MPTAVQLVLWIVVGLVGGTVAGFAITWHRAGFRVWRNAALGLIGALIGGFLFGLFPGLDRISISLRDVAAAR